ncbi:uncharacterized protein L969DRAFT_96776 [Mixia osmundae IAM 14324]|uniref:Uncharacterized protein n=1 Tax=Mixia osmundae (strain CBS 9802 / IAM 14324 / JCM 22182 / KY 12970) TaxID=764103 RepID=G7DSZ8_MIXOS|nr:uncharacterized protein L969DRAFT_96776 [Mixia osmundae IAM 14324]KEI37222.1 hypothetical protein L969DRAFT_96776 [Mixia osmundae IAM 14324]GAA93708.1 hypothetical protein E5Q_00354 [Mixia osmundae IAM 14324]
MVTRVELAEQSPATPTTQDGFFQPSVTDSSLAHPSSDGESSLRAKLRAYSTRLHTLHCQQFEEAANAVEAAGRPCSTSRV